VYVPGADGVDWILKVTLWSRASRPPPSWLRTQTVLPLTVESHMRPLETDTMLAPSTLALGMVTPMQPISFNGSPLVPTRVKVVETPVVAVRGEAVRVQSSAAATWDGRIATASAAAARAVRAGRETRGRLMPPAAPVARCGSRRLPAPEHPQRSPSPG
jgi:hypothetical protein